jgi:hypothetical protein
MLNSLYEYICQQYETSDWYVVASLYQSEAFSFTW